MPITRTAFSDEGTASRAVVEAVAEAEGVSPMDVRPPLYRTVDPDALDDLFRSSMRSAERDLSVSLHYAGYEVTVHGTGEVVVREADDVEHAPTA